jgi:hypothetical protein
MDVERELDELFDAARRVTEPTRRDRTRIGKALAAKVAAAAVAGSVSTKAAGATAAAATGIFGKGLKVMLLTQVVPGLVAGGLLGGGASWLASASPNSEVLAAPSAPSASADHTAPALGPPMSRPTASTRAVTEPPPAVRPKPSQRLDSPRTAEAPPLSACQGAACPPQGLAGFPAPARGTDASELNSELELISRLHRAWQSGNWAGAQQAISEHERRFPRGTLAEERDAIKTMMACRAAPPQKARELAAAFVNKNPSSTHAVRVSAACSANAP